MARYWNDKVEIKTDGNDLEPYRRLVELQKEMIELAQQYEQTRQRRDALLEQLARDAEARQPAPHSLPQRLRRSAAKLLQRVPGLAPAKPDLPSFNHNETLPC